MGVAAVQTSLIERVKAQAPYFPRCSDDKTAKRVRPVEHAVHQPYMQINRKDMKSWLIFDLDHQNPFIWEDAGLPPPNCIVSNRDNQKAHLYYAIVPVCTSEKARSKPIQYMQSVYERMAKLLKSDPDYHGSVAKTPGHPWWKTAFVHDSVYDLGELSEYLDREDDEDLKHRWFGKQAEFNSESRHCLLFDNVRYFAYAEVYKARERGNYESFYRIVEAYAFNHNNFVNQGFESNLSLPQVRATARSISRWTWDKYRGASSPVHRGVMMLGNASGMSLEARQRLSAKRTQEKKKQGTASKIRRAYHNLTQLNRKLTQKNLAEAAGLSTATIRRWAEFVEELKGSKVQIVSLGEVLKNRGAEGKTEKVTFDVHQIPAEASADLCSSALSSSSLNEWDKGTDDSDTEPPPT